MDLLISYVKENIMSLNSWQFNWQGQSIEIDLFEDVRLVGLWVNYIGRLRVNGKKIDELSDCREAKANYPEGEIENEQLV